METWKNVPTSNGKYQVSNTGRVKHVTTGYILNPHLHKDYWCVNFRLPGKGCRHYRVHRLVMWAFVGTCPEGQQVNHKNGIKTDNRLENLEYVTPAGNVRHAMQNGLLVYGDRFKGENNPRAKLTRQEVDEIRKYAAGGWAKRALARKYGVSPKQIRHILSGTNWPVKQ